MMKRKDVGLLALRVTTGGLLAGHGAQKLFGAFGGHGMEGTGQFMESLGLQPGKQWAALAGLSEFGGGVLTALGLAHPLGPIAIVSAMTMASATAHAGKPIWSTEGGAELPVTNIGSALALAITGPGRLSLDHALDLHIPRPIVGLFAAAAAGGVLAGLSQAQAVNQEAESTEAEQPQPAAEPKKETQPEIERAPERMERVTA
jgi:putative oxidoreductase